MPLLRLRITRPSGVGAVSFIIDFTAAERRSDGQLMTASSSSSPASTSTRCLLSMMS